MLFGRAGAAAVAVVLAASASASAGPTPTQSSGKVFADEPAWSPDGRRIAFIGGPSEDPGTLYVMNADGSRVRPLTEKGFAAGWPSWSPDGRRIAFDHRAPRETDPNLSDLYIVNADGSGLRKLLSGGRQPAWGPGGKRIALVRPGRLGQDLVHTISPGGKNLRLLADSRDECTVYIQPTWSPDGEHIAFAATGAGFECSLTIFIGAARAPGAKVRVLADGWFDQPDWSPDGKRLALVKFPRVPRNPYYTVATFDLRTRHLRSLRAGWHPRWSPDGRRLVFVRGNPFGPKPTSQIYVMNADGSNLRRLTP